jgi:hypothetical protein
VKNAESDRNKSDSSEGRGRRSRADITFHPDIFGAPAPFRVVSVPEPTPEATNTSGPAEA